ncbi:hypothetical protein I4U23_029710 [Adineta vaga]|nr:hypothetical protein I4U23_029710 [Adineta vaga]
MFITVINSRKITKCISNTPCNCYLTERSFALLNCSNYLPDLPVFNSNLSLTITTIFARDVLSRWPLHLCEYSHLQILDLSGSDFHLQSIDLSCLVQLIYLNLSHTQLNQTPNFTKVSLKNLQYLDLSSNQIEYFNGNHFRSMNNLMELFLHNNPLKQIDSFEQFLSLPSLEHLNLNFNSSNSIIPMKKPLTISQWIYLAHKWNNTNKVLQIRTNTIPLQSIFPPSNQLHLIPIESMKIILNILSNSTFTILPFASKCYCNELQNYQRIFSFMNNEKNLSTLVQSSTCLMPDGVAHNV